MSIAVRFAAVLVLFSPAASAQWLPQWASVWQHPEPFHGAGVRRVRVTGDGATFVAVDVTHHSRAHAALVRFDADGTFAWLREHEALDVAAIEPMPGGRIALVATGATAGATIDLRVYDGASGELAWSRGSDAARLRFDERHETRHLAIDAAGNVLVVGSDGGDFVVLRWASNGDALPTWRYATGDAAIVASAVLALPDGGAIVSGQGDSIDGGYRTVRFDAAGAMRFDDTEPGDIGNPLGPSYLAATPDGGFLVVAAPESTFGVPEATVWKLAADGARAWKTTLPNPNAPSSFDVGGFAATSDGDALVVGESVTDSRFRLMRVR
ncbi:MAG TPA: hypothetical protein VJ724_08225, partial [Tahibacter sp.]|nr:hypothetical protein [Tahibacter sp.]